MTGDGGETVRRDERAIAVLARVGDRNQQRPHIAVERHAGDRVGIRGQRVDRHAAVEAAHPQRGRAGLGQRGNRLDLEVVRGPDRGHRNRLVDAGEHPVEEFAVEGDVSRTLGFDTDARHRFDGIDRVFAAGALTPLADAYKPKSDTDIQLTARLDHRYDLGWQNEASVVSSLVAQVTGTAGPLAGACIALHPPRADAIGIAVVMALLARNIVNGETAAFDLTKKQSAT